MRPIGLYFSELPTNEASWSKDANVCSYVWAKCGYKSIYIGPAKFSFKIDFDPVENDDKCNAWDQSLKCIIPTGVSSQTGAKTTS